MLIVIFYFWISYYMNYFQRDDTEFSFDNITTEHGNNFTILFENWDKILSALQNYY